MADNSGSAFPFGAKVISSAYYNDYKTYQRTWRERLLTRPWRPWQKTKSVYEPSVTRLDDGTLVMSLQSYDNLLKELSKREGE